MRNDQQTSIRPQPKTDKWLGNGDDILSFLLREEEVLRAASSKDAYWQARRETLQLLKQARQTIRDNQNTLENLNNVSLIDPLTTILNRRGFVQNLTREIDRLNRGEATSGTIILVDIDNYALIVSTFGKKAGESALKLVAKSLQNDIRTMDCVARLNDDNFALLFANTGEQQSFQRAQNIMRKLNNLSFIKNGQEIAVRASLGTIDYNDDDCVENIMRKIDNNIIEQENERLK